MKRNLLGLSAIFLSALGSPGAEAQGVKAALMSDGAQCGSCTWIQLTGEIAGGDAEKVSKTLDQFPFVSSVQIDSPGGAVVEALNLGRVLRQRGFTVVVGSSEQRYVEGKGSVANRGPGQCYSACVYVLAAGTERLRITGSKIGVHQFSGHVSGGTDDAISVSQEMSATLISYLQKMQVDPAILIQSAAAKPEEISLMSDTEALRLRLLTSLKATSPLSTIADARTSMTDPFGDARRVPPSDEADCAQPVFSLQNSSGSLDMTQRRNRAYRELCLSYFQSVGRKDQARTMSDCPDRVANAATRFYTLASCKADVDMYQKMLGCGLEIWAPAADVVESMLASARYIPIEITLLDAKSSMTHASMNCLLRGGR